MNTIPPNDFSYFTMINDLVQCEPADALDPEIVRTLAAIGIVKGQPFNPDDRTSVAICSIRRSYPRTRPKRKTAQREHPLSRCI